MKRNFWFLAALLLLQSCASNFEEERNIMLNKQEKKDLVSSFEVGKEEANKFNEVDPAVAQAQKEAELKAKAEKLKESGKKKKGKKNSKEAKAESGEVTKTATTPEPGPTPTLTPAHAINYPSDFPELFKSYDRNSVDVWKKFNPIFYKGETSIMAISYLGVTAGYITIISKGIVKVNERLAFDYYARFKSKEAYRYFYWLDDYLETFVDKETFTPIKYSLVQREKKQNVDDLQLFDIKKLKNYTYYKRVKEGSNKDEKKEVYIPRYLQDSFSALQFVRGLPLVKGEKYEIPVATRAETWILKLEVIGEENITVNDVETKAIRIKAETHFPGVLQKSGDIIFWYGADEVKKLLKFQAKVKLGSIYGELVDYKPGVLTK